ncbi:tripartite tricarboxylate transporter substrate binding protein [Pollutimonas sp. H1-120]|uniref:Bug family tripartite tricarboxylate transporter substrate binding protein n=1 Tax=Pollutimonas sp. H1-120 TaxID=3148824 RepID=UPI003B5188B0
MTKTVKALLYAMLLASCSFAAVAAQAASYPSKPITVIVPFPPGAGVDIVTRLVTTKLSAALNQPFVIANRSGAGGTVGAAEAARAAPDGYTLLAAPSSIAVSQSLYKNLSFNLDKDFRAVGLMASVPFILVTNPKVPATSVKELIQLAKEKPDTLTFASTGNGSSPHLSAEMFQMDADIKLRHIPYRGSSPAMNDLTGGLVDMMFANALSVLPQIQSGRLRALAITSATPNPNVPGVPTMQEAGVAGYESETWFSLLAPAATPAPIVEQLNAELNRAMQLPDVQKTLASQAATARSGTPAEIDAYIKHETERFAKLIKASGTHIE